MKTLKLKDGVDDLCISDGSIPDVETGLLSFVSGGELSVDDKVADAILKSAQFSGLIEAKGK